MNQEKLSYRLNTYFRKGLTPKFMLHPVLEEKLITREVDEWGNTYCYTSEVSLLLSDQKLLDDILDYKLDKLQTQDNHDEDHSFQKGME